MKMLGLQFEQNSVHASLMYICRITTWLLLKYLEEPPLTNLEVFTIKFSYPYSQCLASTSPKTSGLAFSLTKEVKTTGELHSFKVANEEIQIVRFSIPWLYHQPKGKLHNINQQEIETREGSREEARKDPKM